MTLILVIDDDHSVRTAVHAVLERQGMDVRSADSGAIGLTEEKSGQALRVLG
jgi:CheY-like chemotaxis protein